MHHSKETIEIESISISFTQFQRMEPLLKTILQLCIYDVHSKELPVPNLNPPFPSSQSESS